MQDLNEDVTTEYRRLHYFFNVAIEYTYRKLQSKLLLTK